ncbi:COMPASS component SWD2 [Pancytospora epiphaga]|nr:COMPASS component SWD2 [Pancytospora epiphaga]
MERGTFEYFSTAAEQCVIREPSGKISSISYSTCGENIIYTNLNTIKVYISSTGALHNIITQDTDKIVSFQKNTILHTYGSSIYYLSLYDNKHLRIFEGHSGVVENITVDSLSDLFMSTGPAESNIWDIRMDSPIKKIPFSGYIGALGQGKQYALANNNLIRIFDMRNDLGPIITTTLNPEFYSRIWYTADASAIVLASSNSYTYLNNTGKSINFVSLENSSCGDTSSASDILFCSSKKHIFAYRMNDRKRLGILETLIIPDVAVLANPCMSEIAVASKDTIVTYKL